MEKKKIQKRKLYRRRDELTDKAVDNTRAIALKYDVKKDRAPKIVASGRGRIAEDILKLAEEHEIPFYEDKTLTELLSKLHFDEEIPGDLYPIVAEVLAFVYQLDQLAKGKEGKTANVNFTKGSD